MTKLRNPAWCLLLIYSQIRGNRWRKFRRRIEYCGVGIDGGGGYNVKVRMSSNIGEFAGYSENEGRITRLRITDFLAGDVTYDAEIGSDVVLVAMINDVASVPAIAVMVGEYLSMS